jgi:hypothetical protein
VNAATTGKKRDVGYLSVMPADGAPGCSFIGTEISAISLQSSTSPDYLISIWATTAASARLTAWAKYIFSGHSTDWR